MKNIRIFYLKILHSLVVKISVHLNRHVFVMQTKVPIYRAYGRYTLIYKYQYLLVHIGLTLIQY